MKSDRLMGIVIYLMNHGRTTARELAREFEVSPRTIMRDLGSLEQAGIPLQSFPGADGGYQLIEDYVLRRQYATGSEYGWIAAALKGFASAYAAKDVTRILEKIEYLQSSGSPAISVDLSAAREDSRVNDFLHLLEGAIGRRHAVRFTYTNSRGEVRSIQVDPLNLEYKWYNWYLAAYYAGHGEICTFKLVRMDDLTETDVPCGDMPAEPPRRETDAELIRVRLIGKPCARAVCREYLNGRITAEHENGDFEYEFTVPGHEFFWFGAILSLGSNVRILEPAGLRERIVNTCKEVLTEYEHND